MGKAFKRENRGRRDSKGVPFHTAVLALALAAACWTSAAAQSTNATCPDDESHGTPWERGPSGECYKVVKAGMYNRVGVSVCAEEVCAPIGGALAEVPDEDTSAFLYELMGKAGVAGAYFGMYQPPDADPAYLYEGWTWASGYNGTYEQWAAGEPSHAFERCAALTVLLHGDWADEPCAKSYYVNGCLCQHGKASTPTFTSLLPELEDPQTVERIRPSLTTAATSLLFALILYYAVPWLLRRALKPFVRRVATTLCGTRPIGAEQGGSDSGAEGGGGAAAGKAIPQFAIT
eukprot:CAMPEP_0182529622 /NCGR_PEP_ID=MMETSP1323-20130603/5321_1 /TAXON_ID=236787 /ORGANISM="Florenciella parvula, Strain RCC1693" /LENGTH=289 /DNA_ID=CAMNT_0024738841 /DNA_START=27 /DNA_END=892 /DNA_ORIENTATION=-